MKIHTPHIAMSSSARRQAGLTLIEMMITILIALFLIGGLLVMVQHTRSAYTNTNQLSQLQDGERLAITMITDVVQSAGYFPDPTQTTTTGAFPTVGAFAAGQVVTGIQGVSVPEDTLSVRFMTTGADGILNCLGQSNPNAGPGAAFNISYINTFSINDKSQLQCELNDGTTTTKLPLVDGVQNLQVWYGVKRLPQDNYNVDTYMRQADMAPADWQNVSAVKIVLTFSNPLSGQPGQPVAITFERVIAVMNRAGVKT